MSFLSFIYTEIFYRPVLNSLLFLTSVLPGHDLGFAVILLTILIRILVFPLTHKMLKTQHAMKKIEPDIKRIYAEKKNKEEQAKALMELYKVHGINPLSGIFSIIIQLPLLIAMYRVFLKGIPFHVEEVYGFLKIPENIGMHFLGLIALGVPSMAIAFLAAASQFIQMKLAMPLNSQDPKNASMQKYMLYMFPAMIFVFGLKMPAAVSIYWTAMNVFAIVHEAIVRRKIV